LDGNLPDHELLSSEFGQHFVNFQGARTRYFDEYFSGVIEAGVRQVVILAAGLDSRAFRLPWLDGTTVFELDQPQVLGFKSYVLSQRGIRPTAERREVAVDLREDWPRALRDAGFDPTRPSAWIAEGLLIYLPAVAQEQLFAGIDGLAASGSHVAVEDGTPMPQDAYDAAVAAEVEAGDDTRIFHRLVYNEQHAPADQWFGARGWTASVTPLASCLQGLGRPVPEPDSPAGQMILRNSLMWAVKR
jgi:methyltransferase (TIGR00027 family)